MKLFAPDYYEKFKCIAHECKHNCCIGWEIDIDDLTLDYYGNLDGEMGQRLRNNISFEGETAHFCLGERERCPFLNEKNLCDIITELSEDALCDICADHPRFRNYTDSRAEIGLGLCCESAARLIIENTHKVKLICIDDDGENESEAEGAKALLEVRDRIFAEIQDREKSIDHRMESVLELCKVKRKNKSFHEKLLLYISLERLSEKWEEFLFELKNNYDESLSLKDEKAWETVFEQLLHYFVYRHFLGAFEDGREGQRLLFAVESVDFIRNICAFHQEKFGSIDMEDVVEYCRMYSSEVEYSEENMEKLLDFS